MKLVSTEEAMRQEAKLVAIIKTRNHDHTIEATPAHAAMIRAVLDEAMLMAILRAKYKHIREISTRKPRDQRRLGYELFFCRVIRDRIAFIRLYEHGPS